MKKHKLIYLDYAAATPVCAESLKALEPFLSENFGNASSLHKQGMKARMVLEESRRSISNILGCRPEEIIFTGGGTESCNLAILGMGRMALKNAGRSKPHFITTRVEHHAVLECFRELEGLGARVTYLNVDKEGYISPDVLKKAVGPETVLVSVMYANNEIGTVQNIPVLSKIVHSYNINSRTKGKAPVLFHTDACQAPGFLDLKVNFLGVDLLSLSASKFYGPKGCGVLFVRKEFNNRLQPILFGGGQEGGIRSGTENVSGIVGMSRALEVALKHSANETLRILKLQNYFVGEVLKIKDVKINGPLNSSGPTKSLDFKPKVQGKMLSRLPGNINFSVKGVEGEDVMLYLDAKGICVSTGSACSTGSTERSHVIKSIGVKAEEWLKGVIRISLGKFTTKEDLDYTLKELKEIIYKLRQVSEKQSLV
ncbi:MAG: cysteine desulfurase [Candidatus Doudnabacteria bacterium]|nr:cysteine desulfurase [Candidatus Doudnabacteria bacterium]